MPIDVIIQISTQSAKISYVKLGFDKLNLIKLTGLDCHRFGEAAT